MKKVLWIIILVFAITGIGLGAFYFVTRKNNSTQNHDIETIYTCPMHPEIIRNKPGKCPICGMNLVQKVTKNVALSKKDLANVLLPTDTYVIGNYNTVHPKDTSLLSELFFPGVTMYDPNSSITISARMDGRLEKMYVKYKFQQINKGQKLFEIYSPELLTEQQNFLYILKNDSENSSLIESGRQKLMLYGMTKNQIETLSETKTTHPNITIYSPVDGIIDETQAVGMKSESMSQVNLGKLSTQALNLKEGSYIKKNTPIFRLISVKNIWGVFNVLQGSNDLISKGSPVKITSELNRKTSFDGKIDFIETQLKSENKTNSFRVYILNTQLKLPIGLRLEASTLSGPIKGLFIQRQAFVTIGSKQVVFIKKDKHFFAKEVELAHEINGYVKVLSGLTTQDEIAENAQYLTDSESFIKMK
jgi:membrane fusion protein, copper/silver efflux system